MQRTKVEHEEFQQLEKQGLLLLHLAMDGVWGAATWFASRGQACRFEEFDRFRRA